MVMANLPARQFERPLSDRQIESLTDHLARGLTARKLARKLHPHDKVLQRRANFHLENAVLYDPRVKEKLTARAQATLAAGLIPTIEALVARATIRRDPVAIKLLLEITGYHNPKVQHEHSGEIKIKVEMPRPTFEGDVVDADVVS